MNGPNTDVIQGTLDMLILKTLSLEPMHGFGIARRVEQVKGDGIQITVDAVVDVEGGSKPVCAAQMVLRYYR